MLTRRDILKQSMLSLGLFALPSSLLQAAGINAVNDQSNWIDDLSLSGWRRQKVWWPEVGISPDLAVTQDIVLSPLSGKGNAVNAVSEILDRLPSNTIAKVLPAYADGSILLLRNGNLRARITLYESTDEKNSHYMEEKSNSIIFKKDLIPHRNLENGRDAALFAMEYLPLMSPHLPGPVVCRTIDAVTEILSTNGTDNFKATVRTSPSHLLSDTVNRINMVIDPQLRQSLFVCSPTYANMMLTRN